MTKTLAMLLLTAALAGCVQVDEGVDKSYDETGPDPVPTQSAAPPAANEPPIAALQALVGGTPIAPDANGTLKAEQGQPVTFSAAASTDPNDDPLTFNWVLDGVEASTHAAQYTVTFNTLGTRTVEVTVSDGELDAGTSLEIEIIEPTLPPTAGGAGGAVTYAFEGAWADPTISALERGDVADGGSYEHTFDVPQGATRLQAYLTWTDALTTPYLTDLDLYLLDGSGVERGSAATFTVFELAEIDDPAELPAGTWTALVAPFVVPPEVVTYDLNIIVFSGEPTVTEFTGGHEAAVSLGADLPVETEPDVHTFTVPDGATGISARLTWTSADAVSCTDVDPEFGFIPLSIGPATANDYDLYIYNAAGSEIGLSGAFGSCEFAIAGGNLAPGEYSIEVVPFLVTASTYTLTVQVA